MLSVNTVTNSFIRSVLLFMTWPEVRQSVGAKRFCRGLSCCLARWLSTMQLIR